jgi:acyl-CoA reductase-like NAD-dependent aldehyde dehydrogenase
MPAYLVVNLDVKDATLFATYTAEMPALPRDLKEAMQAIQRLEGEFVQVNQNLVVQPGLSYGGYKQSGLGKEASLEAMVEHFTRMKTAIINIEWQS